MTMSLGTRSTTMGHPHGPFLFSTTISLPYLIPRARCARELHRLLQWRNHLWLHGFQRMPLHLPGCARRGRTRLDFRLPAGSVLETAEGCKQPLDWKVRGCCNLQDLSVRMMKVLQVEQIQLVVNVKILRK